VKTHKLFKKIQ